MGYQVGGPLPEDADDEAAGLVRYVSVHPVHELHDPREVGRWQAVLLNACPRWVLASCRVIVYRAGSSTKCKWEAHITVDASTAAVIFFVQCGGADVVWVESRALQRK